MSVLREVEAWDKKLKGLETKRVRAEAKLEQTMAELAKMGYDSVESAEEALKSLKEQYEAAESKAKELLESFEVRYAKFLD